MHDPTTWREGIRTTAVHAGQAPDPSTGASAPTLVMSNSFVVEPDTPFSAHAASGSTAHVYSRWSNPTVAQLETALAALEGAEAGTCFASGMAAAAALFFHLLRRGDHLVISDIAYAGVAELVRDTLAGLGVEVTAVDTSDLGEVTQAVGPRTRLLYTETPCNPILRLADIRELASVARAAGILLAVDSTFATPVATRPLELGADFVVHSLSKYIGGHGDALGGAVLGSRDRLGALRRDTAVHLGGTMSPFNAWLILRGLATLPLRMAAHADGALRVATFLEGHPGVSRVIYPGLPSHPQHDLARRQMRCSSGILTFQTPDSRNTATALARRLRVFHYAVSLGHHRSLLFYLPTDDLLASSFRLNDRQAARYRAFAGEGVFRVSVGIEDPDDLCADLGEALGG